VYDYDAIRYSIESGARLIHLDVYNTSSDPTDVVLGVGDVNSLSFRRCMETVNGSAWKQVDYPMIMLLNIHSAHYTSGVIDAINYHLKLFGLRLYSGVDTIDTMTYQSARNKVIILVNDKMEQRRPMGCAGTVKMDMTESNRVGETDTVQSLLYSMGIDAALRDPTPINPNDVYVSNRISYVGYACHQGSNCAEPLRKFSMMIPENDEVQSDVKTAMLYRVSCIMMNFHRYDTQMALALDMFKDRSFELKQSASLK
jgi:hypothetical protein